ncbi:MAG: PaaI family thioesterase [Archangium sp.]|nr:PaaI family thioesterase [Archangium sp.]
MSGDRSRVIQWNDPAETTRGAEGRTGLAFLRAIIDGAVPPAPLQATLGIDLVFADDGTVRFSGTPGEHWYNPMGAVHGGVVCTLLDSCMGAAVMSTLDEKTGYTTVELSVHLVRGITVKTGPVTAEGRVVHRGNRLMTAEGRLADTAGTVLAHGTTSCFLLPR